MRRARNFRSGRESDARSRAHVLVVVGDEQLAAPVIVLGEDVELDHVDPVRERSVEARERVSGLDVRGALVPDAPRPDE